MFADVVSGSGHSVNDVGRCHEVFAEIDGDGSGFLDEKEVKQLAEKIGFREQIKAEKGFIKKMIQEMEAAYFHRAPLSSPTASPRTQPAAEQGASDGKISCTEFISW